MILIDLSREEIAIAERYPAHTSLCIRGGWEFCHPEHAVGKFYGIAVAFNDHIIIDLPNLYFPGMEKPILFNHLKSVRSSL